MPIVVRILKPKNGETRAQILIGSKALPATSLAEFNDQIRNVFGDSPRPGNEVSCADNENPTPGTVKPAPGAKLSHPANPSQFSNRPRDATSGRARGLQRTATLVRRPETCKLQEFRGEEPCFDPEQVDRRGPLTVDALKVTDRFLAARPGARFTTGRDRTLARYATDVLDMGLAEEPDIDRNPYNFVPWIGTEPNKAQEPEKATHDRIAAGRLSGRMTVTFTAQTPIFVPEGQLPKRQHGPDRDGEVDRTPLRFFRCWDGTCDRYAIPGASVKGAVRSLFEALTNSRAGVTDTQSLTSGRRNQGQNPLSMMGSFAERKAEEQRLAGSDPAEVAFGFAGRHAERSHPFRGRVRFGTFWGPCVTDSEPDPLQLMQLTAPSGTKAKARPLYLEPGGTGLRGRKFYWHQRTHDRGVPRVHDLNALKAAVPAAWLDKTRSQLPSPIRPLPADTTFAGTLHFTNLTEAELGALLVSTKPDLAFGSEGPAATAKDGPVYGIKLGKGKPRGLGSVTASIELELATSPRQHYHHLDAPLVKGVDHLREYVDAYKCWSRNDHESEAAPRWDDMEMAKALRALLRIPEETSVRVYPPQFSMYGDQAKAMTPAHKLTGP